MEKKAAKKKKRAKKLAWGESADVYLLPRGRVRLGARVVRIERRFRGELIKFSHKKGLCTYYCFRIARLLFPEHVINVRGLKPFGKKAGKLDATPKYYSKYYPLPRKAKADIEHIRRRIEAAHKGKADWGKIKEEVKAFDKKMREIYPGLIPTAKKLEEAGFVVPHPELNFTVHKGKIMFFEIELKRGTEVDVWKPVLHRILSRVKMMRKPEARRLFINALKLICRYELVLSNEKRIRGDTASCLHHAILFDFYDTGILRIEERNALARAIRDLPASRSKREAERLFRMLSLGS